MVRFIERERLPLATSPAHIAERILVLRGHKVMIDADLAELYGVETKRLNEQVRRNQARFPRDFMFQLTLAERSEVVANCDHLRKLKFSHSLPYAFTEHGALMAASILNTERAVEVSVYVVRAFVQLREMLVSNKDLAAQLAQLERKFATHDQAIASIIATIRQLMAPPQAQKKPPIGFVRPKEK
ncbi:MAG TPA: ORF6N domain-containing protein [Usitatibacteraceae bacterium]|nr:ORF6N domain-containing protein [Usitatibacteraceae bacterium]